MPKSEADAMTQTELFGKAVIPSRSTGRQALHRLLVTERIERIGKGCKGNLYRYFVEARL